MAKQFTKQLEDQRDVKIVIGKRTYNIYTRLDDSTLKSVTSIVNSVISEVDSDKGHEKTLMMTCMNLAYYLNDAEQRLASLLDKIDKR
ncbi:hypothetical protein FACS1894187_00170 [Synergistales bacterium]|nr:hypothetical protein FACS1894187_00170 [Synergistales bacterium]